MEQTRLIIAAVVWLGMLVEQGLIRLVYVVESVVQERCLDLVGVWWLHL